MNDNKGNSSLPLLPPVTRVVVDMNLDLMQEGVWTDAPDMQGQIMRARIFSKGAKSITLQFSTFDLPQGADVFIFSGYTSEYFSSEDVGRTETDLTMVSSEHPGPLQNEPGSLFSFFSLCGRRILKLALNKESWL